MPIDEDGDSQWMDAAVETIMNILDQEDSMVTDTKIVCVDYDFPESPGALELSPADRRKRTFITYTISPKPDHGVPPECYH